MRQTHIGHGLFPLCSGLFTFRSHLFPVRSRSVLVSYAILHGSHAQNAYRHNAFAQRSFPFLEASQIGLTDLNPNS